MQKSPKSNRVSGGHRKAAEWVYRGIWSNLVRWFRVPDRPPEPPIVHDGETYRSFQPSTQFLRYLKLWFWISLAAFDLAIFVGFVVISISLAIEGLWFLAVPLAPLAAVVAIVPGIISYIAIHLRYDTTWYVITGRSLRIRRGIWSIHETTITFENVQNLKIHQGPIQRYLGITELIAETAGAGAAQQGQHGGGFAVANRGVIEGIDRDTAVELRDSILDVLRSTKSAGLGDERDAASGSAGWTAQHVELLREIREAVAGLR